MKKTFVLGALFSTLSTLTLCAPESLCPNATTTRDMEQCVSVELQQKAEKSLDRYLAEGIHQAADNPDARVSLGAAQAAWVTYGKAHCMAVYKLYEPGSAASLQMGDCKLGLVRQRTHELWETYMSNRTSSLSEPKR